MVIFHSYVSLPEGNFQHFHGFHSHFMGFITIVIKKHQKITRNPSQSPIFDGQIEKNPSNKSPQISEVPRISQVTDHPTTNPQPPSHHHSTFQRVLREDLSSQVELIDHGGERGVFHRHAVASASHWPVESSGLVGRRFSKPWKNDGNVTPW